MSEHTETLAALQLVAFRRFGANRVHFALVLPESLIPATHWGAACTILDGPVSAFCNRVLRGEKFVIPDENRDGWKQQGHVCRECTLVARVALAKAENDGRQ